MKNDYTYIKYKGICVRIDYFRPEKSIDYQIGDDEWVASPYQSANLKHLGDKAVARFIYDWIEGQY